MKKLSMLALLVALCVGPAMSEMPGKVAPAAAAPAAPAVKAAAVNEEEGIQKLFADLTAAWTAGDAKLMASHWLKDGSLISPMGTAAWGREEVEQVVAGDIQHFGGTNTFSDLKIVSILPGGFALVDATATITGLKNADGSAAPDMGHHVYGAVVNRGGKWYVKALRPYVFLQPPSAVVAVDPAAPVVESGDAKKDSKKKK